MDAADPTENLSFYNEEMEQCALDYAAYVLELVEGAKKSCKDPVVLIEQSKTASEPATASSLQTVLSILWITSMGKAWRCLR